MSRSVGYVWTALVAAILVAIPLTACEESDDREVDIDIHIPRPATPRPPTVRPAVPKPASTTPTRRPRADEIYPPKFPAH